MMPENKLPKLTPGDFDILVRTVAGEARGEKPMGKKAVVHVIWNRTQQPRFRAHTVAGVCLAYKQFSCWNKDDPNFQYIQSLDVLSETYTVNVVIVKEALSEDDFTQGATHYHTRSLNPVPTWAKGHTPCYKLGGHVFYNDIP